LCRPGKEDEAAEVTDSRRSSASVLSDDPGERSRNSVLGLLEVLKDLPKPGVARLTPKSG
jgi:hypothetical protein